MENDKCIKELIGVLGKNVRQVDELIMEKTTGKIEYPNLFHYTSIEGMKNIVIKNNLWATDYRFLNDAQEMLDGNNILMKVLKSSEHYLLNTLCERIDIEGLVTTNYINPHILSFCSTNDLLSQWRAYGGESEGVCLEFDLFTSYLSADKNSWSARGHLVPVVYDDLIKEEIIVDIMKSLEVQLLSVDITNEYYKGLSEYDQNYLIGLVWSAFVVPILSFKDKSFKEESEWRAIFLPSKDEIENLRDFRTSNGTFTPYIEAFVTKILAGGIAENILLPIKSVCLPPASGNSSHHGLNLFLQKYGHKDDNAVNVYRSSIPLRSKQAIHW
ncbi:MAG: DUF2971 domain-containing protein [Colwellia sp.]|nr:DUF2971 domain-containing protein [Colwellia sp.]